MKAFQKVQRAFQSKLLSQFLPFVHLTSFQKTVLVPHEFLEIEICIPVNPISVTRDILVTFFLNCEMVYDFKGGGF